MKNFILGCLFLTLGIGLNTWSIWKISHSRSAKANPAATGAASPAALQHDAPPASSSGSVGSTQANASAAPADSSPVSSMTADSTPVADAPPSSMTVDSTPPRPAASTVVLLFDHRSQSISPALTAQLTQLAKENPDARFRMDVAAGEMKTAPENEKLAKRRARAVRKVLQDAGIPERRVSYRILVPGPDDGEPPKTSEDWRKTTVRVAKAQ